MTLLNSVFSLVRKFLTVGNSRFLLSKSSMTFFFYISADLSYIYNNIHYTCFSTNTFLIFILIYNLYTIIKSAILRTSPLNIGSLATSTFDLVFDPVLSLEALISISSSSSSTSLLVANNACNTAICSTYCII